MTDIHLTRARYAFFIKPKPRPIRMPKTLKPDDRPSKDQMRTAIEWLRKNDLGDDDTMACEKTARFLEAKILESGMRMAAREMSKVGEI